MCLAR